MLRNYFTTALRNFLRNPIYSAINVSGLALGLMGSIFIFLWVIDELSYDNYHKDNERTYKVMRSNSYSDGSVTTDAWTSGTLAENLKAEIPEIQQASRLAWAEEKLFSYGETSNYHYGDYADGAILDALNLKVLEGNALNVLPDINSIAISKKTATKYFRNERAVGKTLRIDNKSDATITAVFEDIPENTTESFEFILPFEVYIKSETGSLENYNGDGWQYTIVKLDNKEHKKAVDAKIAAHEKAHEKQTSTPPPSPFLQSMVDWHLHNNFVNGTPSGGRINYVISFSLVAVLILIIACINFMNLSTARSINRSREVGIRKVAGASRSILVRQFLTESILVSFLSMSIALVMVNLLLPLFNTFTEKNIVIDYNNPLITGSIISIALLTGFYCRKLSAFFLSSFRPALVLKGNAQSALSGGGLRKVLVVFQFALSTAIVVCAMVISEQITFMRNKNLGFDKNNVLMIKTNEEILKNYESFKNQMLQSPLIKSVSMSNAHPMEINGSSYYDWKGKSADDDTYFNQAGCDYDYLETVGFTFVQGRNFSPEFPSDSVNYIVTEEVANRIGFSNPIGQRFGTNGGYGEIIGVIKDFNNLSIHEAAHPTVFSLSLSKTDFGRWVDIYIRYEPETLTETLELLNKTYKANSPGFPLKYGFVDKKFENQFRTELIVSSLSFCFTILAIIISCLGLFGLAAFSTERRTKEIGIRKVLGASIKGLTVLLCKDFTRLIVYSIIIGSPIAYFVMENFLSKYPYHTDLNFWMFVTPALVMFLISLSIVSYQSIKAALGNPVDALRSE